MNTGPTLLPYLFHLSLLFALTFPTTVSAQAIRIIDDAGDAITLPQPAERIISLAPNLTELLFAAGAGNKIVATVRYSDWPAEAKSIPLIGDSFNLDIEAILRLQPVRTGHARKNRLVNRQIRATGWHRPAGPGKQ